MIPHTFLKFSYFSSIIWKFSLPFIYSKINVYIGEIHKSQHFSLNSNRTYESSIQNKSDGNVFSLATSIDSGNEIKIFDQKIHRNKSRYLNALRSTK